MKRLLSRERNGHRIDNWWLHTGDDGNDRITIETVEDVEPTFKRVQHMRDAPKSKDFRHVASIPQTVIEEICRLRAQDWGGKPHEVFNELMRNKTDRAQGVWKMLTLGRDYRKFQNAG